jgi:hypothetical protein
MNKIIRRMELALPVPYGFGFAYLRTANTAPRFAYLRTANTALL